jgi:hypothetical protein
MEERTEIDLSKKIKVESISDAVSLFLKNNKNLKIREIIFSQWITLCKNSYDLISISSNVNLNPVESEIRFNSLEIAIPKELKEKQSLDEITFLNKHISSKSKHKLECEEKLWKIINQNNEEYISIKSTIEILESVDDESAFFSNILKNAQPI